MKHFINFLKEFWKQLLEFTIFFSIFIPLSWFFSKIVINFFKWFIVWLGI